ncbi:MAG: PTS sugar transporter subunit IIA [Pseudolabrys sp.]|nr:PTS sugar transporter subunit IIA [Pseudolabrys sp.]
MKISDFLAPSHVQIDLRVSDKAHLIRELAQRAAAPAGLSADTIVAALAQREALGSTGLGGGVAIPHARFAELKQPFGMLTRLRKAIAFDAIDGQPVNVVFLLLLPAEKAGEQLNALATVARKLRDRGQLELLTKARDASAFYERMVAE